MPKTIQKSKAREKRLFKKRMYGEGKGGLTFIMDMLQSREKRKKKRRKKHGKKDQRDKR